MGRRGDYRRESVKQAALRVRVDAMLDLRELIYEIYPQEKSPMSGCSYGLVFALFQDVVLTEALN